MESPKLRECGECNLCCKLERIKETNKPGGAWCINCKIGTGCRIYDDRPETCRQFNCLWKRLLDMPEEIRPDKVHMYVVGNLEDYCVKVVVDPDYPNAWKEGIGAEIIERIALTTHMLVMVGRQINFVPSIQNEMPEKLNIEWILPC